MAGDDDPYQLQWNLKPRIEALRAEANDARKDALQQFKSRDSELGIERDRVARDEYAAEQAAKSAAIQVERENREAAENADEIKLARAEVAAAERAGDAARAEEFCEYMQAQEALQDAHLARARQAELDAAELRADAANHGLRLTELEVERRDLLRATDKATEEIDKLEDEARLLEAARLKYTEADLAGDDVAARSAAMVEAERLIAQAEAVEVDRAAIREVLPSFPDTTPGIDEPPPPLPEGAVDDDTSWLDEFIEDDAAAEIDLGAGESTGATDDLELADVDFDEVDFDDDGFAPVSFDDEPVVAAVDDGSQPDVLASSDVADDVPVDAGDAFLGDEAFDS